MFKRLVRPRSVISKIGFDPVTASPDRDGLAVVVVVKNEASFIAEWVRFHEHAGVSTFLVYDNGSVDGTGTIAVSAALRSKVEIIPWGQKLFDARSGIEIHNQVLAFSHAIRNFGQRFRWMAFIDVDEYLFPTRKLSIIDALDHVSSFPQISVPWTMFGRNGLARVPETGVVKNFHRCMRSPLSYPRALNFKVIVDPSRVTAVRVHGFDVDGVGQSVNDVGRLAAHGARKTEKFLSNKELQLNHYYTRGDLDLEEKLRRGSNKTVEASQHRKTVMKIVDAIEAQTREDRAAEEFLRRVESEWDQP